MNRIAFLNRGSDWLKSHFRAELMTLFKRAFYHNFFKEVTILCRINGWIWLHFWAEFMTMFHGKIPIILEAFLNIYAVEVLKFFVPFLMPGKTQTSVYYSEVYALWKKMLNYFPYWELFSFCMQVYYRRGEIYTRINPWLN